MRLLLLLCLLVPAFAADAAEPGLAGVWSLDAAASDSVDPLLAALGRSKMERSMAKRITEVTHTVVLGDGWVEVTNANRFRTSTSRTTIGETSTVDSMGKSMDVLTTIVDGRVTTKATTELKDGPALMETSRGLTDPTTTELVITLTPKDGAPIVVRRVFRKQP